MTREFIQNRGFEYRKFTLCTDIIRVEYKSTSELVKYEISLEELGFEKTYKADNPLPRRIFLIVCLFIPAIAFVTEYFKHFPHSDGLILAAIFFLFIAAIFYFKKGQDDIFLAGGTKNIVLFRDVPNEKAVLEFVDEVILTTKQYLKDKYTAFDEYTFEHEYVNGLAYLKKNGIISVFEFQTLTEEFKIMRLLL